jgi:hypothetical protein
MDFMNVGLILWIALVRDMLRTLPNVYSHEKRQFKHSDQKYFLESNLFFYLNLVSILRHKETWLHVGDHIGQGQRQKFVFVHQVRFNGIKAIGTDH